MTKCAIFAASVILSCTFFDIALAADFQPGQLIFLKLDAAKAGKGEPLDLGHGSLPIRIVQIKGGRLLIGSVWIDKDNALSLDEAIPYFTGVLKTAPARIGALYCRGAAWLTKGEYEKAVEDLTAFIRAVPGWAPAYNSRGCALKEMNDLDGAIADFSAAIKLSPKESAAVFLCNRSSAWHAKGEIAEAMEDCDAGLALDPTCGALYNSRGLGFYKRSQWDEAIADFDEAIKLDPTLSQSYLKRGLIRARQNNFQEAIHDLDEGLRLDPHCTDPEVYFERGFCWAGIGKFANAIVDITAAIKLDPKEPRFHHARGSMHARIGQLDLAISDFTAALEIDPDRLEILCQILCERASALSAKRDFGKALADLDLVVSKTNGHPEMDPIHGRALADRGGVFADLGDYRQAIANLSESTDLAPDSFRPHVILAQAQGMLFRPTTPRWSGRSFAWNQGL